MREQISCFRPRSSCLVSPNKASGVHVNLVSVGRLVNVKKAAFRRGVWFRVLSRLERGLIDLTIRYVDSVKSARLAKVLTATLEKLHQATESMIDTLVRTVGIPLARRIGSIAVSWGNRSAKAWASDHAFSVYLVVITSKLVSVQ